MNITGLSCAKHVGSGEGKTGSGSNEYMRTYMKRRRQAARLHTAVIEHNSDGRLVTIHQFWRVMMEFPFKHGSHDPKRLAFAVCFCTGMRSANPKHIKLSMLNYPVCDRIDYQQVKSMPQKDGQRVTWRVKSDKKYLPRWLAELLCTYIDRVLIGFKHGTPSDVKGCAVRDLFKDRPLFPTVSNHALHALFSELRKHFGWHDVWQQVLYFDDTGSSCVSKRIMCSLLMG